MARTEKYGLIDELVKWKDRRNRGWMNRMAEQRREEWRDEWTDGRIGLIGYADEVSCLHERLEGMDNE